MEERDAKTYLQNIEFQKNIDFKDSRIEKLNLQFLDLSEKINDQLTTIKAKNSEINDQNSIIKAKNSELDKLKSDFACDKCDFKAENLLSFVMHAKKQHLTTNVMNFPSADCDNTFPKEFDLKVHKSFMHPKNSVDYSLTKIRQLKTKSKRKTCSKEY